MRGLNYKIRDSTLRLTPDQIVYATHCLHRNLPWSRRTGVVADYPGASAVVRRSEQTPLDSSQLGICACLDNLVHSDGDCSLVGLAEGWLDSSSDATLPAAVVAQRHVVRPLLSAKVTVPGFRRNCHVVVRHPGNIDRIQESSSGRRLVAVALLGMG
jgi:hypothetical protein